MSYAALQVTSNFSFLRGASHPEELVCQAAALGYTAIAITDHNSFAGIVRAHTAAKRNKIRLLPACRIDLVDGPSLLCFPTNQTAYARICTLLSLGNRRTEKGKCTLYTSDFFAHASGSKCILIPPAGLTHSFELDPGFIHAAAGYKNALGKNLYLAASRLYNGHDQKYLFRLSQLARQLGLPLIATNDVYYHIPQRRELQDVMTCIREKCSIYTAGYKLLPNAERYLKSIDEMKRLFRHYPDAIDKTTELADACTFSLDELRYEYPEEITTGGRSPQEELAELAWQGAKEIFGEPLPVKTVNAIRYELAFIAEMNYASYFLTVHDIVRFARSRSILCQGRGSAANSTVCYCLGITSVNPEKFDLLFERFISAARNEPPDIDVDFEHERREEVIQYIYDKYGRDRAAIVATVTQQHYKGAIRDVGKAMGLSVDSIKQLSDTVWETDDWAQTGGLAAQGLDPQDKHLIKVLQLTKEFMGFPRQLGQHTGGFVITKGKLSSLCPIHNARMENRTCIEWNKDDIDMLGWMKVDVLALGMLTCIRKAFDLAAKHYGLSLTLSNIPQDDPAVYEMICQADTIGVFQIESRAQQAMLPRLQPRSFYDLVIEVAIVRPGPIQGDMVHPYLRRRNGDEPVEYPSKELEAILGRTLGVPLFQEQAMKIAIVAAGFTPAEADELRRSMATFKISGMVTRFQKKLITGMTSNGYSPDYAQRVFKQLEGFGSYGFPESHAASFALLVYVSSWIKYYYPEIFACALLNSMPMGFYQPAQIVIDARKHQVEVRPVDVNYSEWNNSLEEQAGKYKALRLGFRQIKGMREQDIRILITGRQHRYDSINALRDAAVPEATIEKLADADAFRSIGIDRRTALWEASTKDRLYALFQGQQPQDARHEKVKLPLMSEPEQVVQDYASLSLSLKAHPVHFLREKLDCFSITPTKDLSLGKNGEIIKVAGLVLVRQRPGTAKGVCFMTIEDETGVANIVIFQNIFDTYRKAALQSKLIMIEGTLQIEGKVVHVIARSVQDYSRLLRGLTGNMHESIAAEGFSEKDRSPGIQEGHKITQQEKLFPHARNFK